MAASPHLPFLLVGAKAPGLGAEVGMRARDQQPNEIGGRLGSATRCQCASAISPKPLGNHRRSPARSAAAVRMKAAKASAVPAGRPPMSGAQRRRRRVDGQRAAAAQMARAILWMSADGFAGVRAAPFRRAVPPCSPESRSRSQPRRSRGRRDRPGCGPCTVAPGIDVGLDRIGLDQALAEAVDGRAGDFVDRRARGREMSR